MYLSGGPLATSPWLRYSNVNGGLGDVGRDPLNLSPTTAPFLSFQLRQLVSFKGSWLSHWCVMAPSLTCPLTAIFGQRTALLSTKHFVSLVMGGEPSPSLSVTLSLSCQLLFLPQCYYFISLSLTQCVKLQTALLSASNYSYWCAPTITIDISTYCWLTSKSFNTIKQEQKNFHLLLIIQLC